MRPEDLEDFLARIVAWARTGDASVVAVGLAGSHARGMASSNSDVDVVSLVPDAARRDALVARHGWVAEFGSAGRVEREHWGELQALRVFYDEGVEAELGVAPASWASTDPVDAGTRHVVADGLRVVWDPGGLLADLVRAVRG